MRDDLRDLALLETLTVEYREAAAADDKVALVAIHDRVDRMLTAEIGESAKETAQATAEVRRDRREIRSDRREIQENKSTGSSVGEAVKDRHDLRDDRRDRRDDLRDAAREKERHERYVALHARWHELDPPGDFVAHKAVLAELHELAKAELKDDAAEAGEDRRELREDRLETLEDRRER
jgi:hypothetical protein